MEQADTRTQPDHGADNRKEKDMMTESFFQEILQDTMNDTNQIQTLYQEFLHDTLHDTLNTIMEETSDHEETLRSLQPACKEAREPFSLYPTLSEYEEEDNTLTSTYPGLADPPALQAGQSAIVSTKQPVITYLGRTKYCIEHAFHKTSI